MYCTADVIDVPLDIALLLSLFLCNSSSCYLLLQCDSSFFLFGIIFKLRLDLVPGGERKLFLVLYFLAFINFLFVTNIHVDMC